MSRSRKPVHDDRPPLARYSNYFEVGHNVHEFIFAFCQYQPESARIAPVATIVTTPTLGKLLHNMLCEAVEKYEAEHGTLESLNDAPDALQSLLQSFPEFEQRALDARLRRLQDATNPPKRTSRKR